MTLKAAATIIFTSLLLLPFRANADSFAHLIEPYFHELPPMSLEVCSSKTSTALVKFSPLTGVEIYSVQDLGGVLCAEVYDEQIYRGTLRLLPDKMVATWSSFAGTSIQYDLSNSAQAQEVASTHTVRSMALSALLHFEEEKLPPAVLPNASCTYLPNGCSAPLQYCGQILIRRDCDQHDWCYQCGSVFGFTRLDCDIQFYNNIVGTTGNYECASAFYWGVRLLGWLFYQDPHAAHNRLHYWGDIYPLGIEMNACAGTQYERMCTTYLF